MIYLKYGYCITVSLSTYFMEFLIISGCFYHPEQFNLFTTPAITELVSVLVYMMCKYGCGFCILKHSDPAQIQIGSKRCH